MQTDILYYQYHKTPYGELLLGEHLNKIVLCDWKYRKNRVGIDKRIKKNTSENWIEKETELLSKLKNELEEYFNKKRTHFSIPIKTIGTDFQKRVWKGLLEIPYGKTTSYLELTSRISTESAIRAVATANGANALSILIPCHRVIGNNGKLVGYAGGMPAKRKLLVLENALEWELFPD